MYPFVHLPKSPFSLSFSTHLLSPFLFLIPLPMLPFSSSLFYPLLPSFSNIYHVSIIKTSDTFTFQLFFIRFSAFMTSPNDLFLVPLYERDSCAIITLQTISFFVTVCTYRLCNGRIPQWLLVRAHLACKFLSFSFPNWEQGLLQDCLVWN